MPAKLGMVFLESGHAPDLTTDEEGELPTEDPQHSAPNDQGMVTTASEGGSSSSGALGGCLYVKHAYTGDGRGDATATCAEDEGFGTGAGQPKGAGKGTQKTKPKENQQGSDAKRCRDSENDKKERTTRRMETGKMVTCKSFN